MRLEIREVRKGGKVCRGCKGGIEVGDRAASGGGGKGKIWFHADRVECAREMRKMGGMVVGRGEAPGATRHWGVRPHRSAV